MAKSPTQTTDKLPKHNIKLKKAGDHRLCGKLQHCCNDDQKSQWGMEILTPCIWEIPKILNWKL